jgi:circadian clock protein KaiC
VSAETPRDLARESVESRVGPIPSGHAPSGAPLLSSRAPGEVEKVRTGIPGFDTVAAGGLPKGRVTLVAGTAGSGKTVFANQFLVEALHHDPKAGGVFVTFEDSPEDIRTNMRSFGWDIAAWEKEGRWAFVDASPRASEGMVVVGEYDLEALVARIQSAVKRVGAQRVSIDSINALFAMFPDNVVLRGELFRIVTALKTIDVTTVMTAERIEDYGRITRFGMEEFVADNVVILRHVLEAERRRRTVEILKFRGGSHQNGEFPFTLGREQGVVVIPLSGIELTQSSSTVRVTSGNDVLDQMCGGGFFRDSIVLVSGATGTGKTLTVTQFMAGGVRDGERCLLFAFEESRDQLFRNAAAWGVDFAAMERDGKLRVVAFYPHARSLEDHLLYTKRQIEDFRPNRVAADSLTALERVGPLRGFREFVIALAATLKQQEICGLLTATAPTLTGGPSITESHISTLTDSILLLRYVETFGVLRRAMAILKMRGSQHERNVREYTIDGKGMHIHGPFSEVTGIMWGPPSYSDSWWQAPQRALEASEALE